MKETAIQMDTRDIEHERTRKKLPVLYYSEKKTLIIELRKDITVYERKVTCHI